MDAKWIKEQFARTGKSQADLARHLKIQPPMVSKMVRGERKVQGTEVDLIRAFFGVTANNGTPSCGWPAIIR